MRYLTLLVALIGLFLTAAVSRGAHVTADLVPNVTAVEPGGRLTVAVVLTIEKDWHLYWINPGETGAPPDVKWTLPPGVTAGPVQFPTPSLINAGGLAAYGYHRSLVLLSDVALPKDATGEIELKARVSWVVCADACVADSQAVSIKVPVAVKRGAANVPEKFQVWTSELPNRLHQPAVATIDADGKHGSVEMKIGPNLTLASFFPPKADFAEFEKPVVEGDRLHARFRVLPSPPASHAADAVTVFNGPGGQLAVIQEVQFTFPTSSTKE